MSSAPSITTTGLPVETPHRAPLQKDRNSDWLCAWCLNRVASDANRYLFSGNSQFSFTNPQGVLFHIITFSEATGCHASGTPTLAHTWFAGHAWSYCHCAQCGNHLGWFYSGPSDFVGLIMAQLVRGCVLN